MRVAILGCDSSHAEIYAELLARAGLTLVGWDSTRTLAESKLRPFGALIVDDVRSALASADCAMIVQRYGSTHYALAEAALAAGRPTYVDKPLCDDFASAAKLRDLALVSGVPLASFTPLRLAPEYDTFTQVARGDVLWASAPAFAHGLGSPQAERLHFYGVHLVELCVGVLGRAIHQVSVENVGDTVVAKLSYAQRCAVLALGRHDTEHYTMAMAGHTLSIDPNGPFYQTTIDALVSWFESHERPIPPLADAVIAVAILDAIEELAARGEPASVRLTV